MPSAVPTLPFSLSSEDVRHNQRTDLETIYGDAKKAIEAEGVSLAEVARRIGKSRQAVHKAMQAPDSALWSIYDAVLRALTPYGVAREERVVYRYERLN